MESKLMPCAHCGGKAVKYSAYDGMFCIQCKVCGITTLHSKFENVVEKVWNRRVSADDHK